MKINFFLVLFVIGSLTAIFYFSGCKGEDNNIDNTENNIEIDETGKTFKFKNRLFSLPSPFHVSDLIKEISSEYNEDLLNPTANKLNYSSTEKKALNLGVYTADLGYSNIYEQFSSTTKYIKVVRSLSSDLQIMNSFTDNLLSNVEKNIESNDSLNKIFTEAYREADLYLTDNDREETSVLILAGGWIEGLYLMTQLAKDNRNKLLINRIGEQKYSLNNLLMLMSQFQTQEKGIRNELYNILLDLQESFEEIKITYEYDKQIILPNEKKTIIISNTEIIVNKKVLKEITRKVKKIRDLIIT